MELKTLRLFLLLLAAFCFYKLGTIHERTTYLKKIAKCVKQPDNVDMATFYGHGVGPELFNHASGHNAHIYMQCIYKDINE